MSDAQDTRPSAEKNAGQETCSIVEVDGESVRVLGGADDWTERDHEAFAEIVRAAKRKFDAQLSPASGTPKNPVDGATDPCPEPGYAGRHTAVGAGAISPPYRCHGCGAWFTLPETSVAPPGATHCTCTMRVLDGQPHPYQPKVDPTCPMHGSGRFTPPDECDHTYPPANRDGTCPSCGKTRVPASPEGGFDA